MAGRVLGVIPARGGSRGLPGKNVRLFAGLPLIAHSILFAKRCPQISRCVVSTEAQEIAAVASRFGAEVPFVRPADLAADETPLWAVVRHALAWADGEGDGPYEYLVLLDPTSPAREPHDLTEALRRLEAAPQADGILAVSRPDFNPVWHCVIERDGWMADLLPQGAGFSRRQDAPVVYRINGALYVWRTAFVRSQPLSWRAHGQHLLLEIPERRAMSIDTQDEFERAEALVKGGIVPLPWLQPAAVS